MNWISARGRLIHIVVLLLFIVSMLGPSTYRRIYAPVGSTCEYPNVPLESGICGIPRSGFVVISMFMEGVITNRSTPIADTFSGHVWEFLVVFFILLILLPFFSTLFMILKKQTRRGQTTHLVIWAIACPLPLWMLSYELDNLVYHLLWGLLLYILIALGSILSEIFLLWSNTVPITESVQP